MAKKEPKWVPLKDNKTIPAFRCACCTSPEREVWISFDKAKKEKIQAQRQEGDKIVDPQVYALYCPHCNNVLVKRIGLADGQINLNARPDDAVEDLSD